VAARLLGIASDATEDQARRAYRRLARRHHPDVGGDPERFAAIADAWASWTLVEASSANAEPEPTPDVLDDPEPIGVPPRRSIVLLPPMLVAGGAVVAVLGTMSGLLPIAAVGVIAIGVGLAAFVLVPFWVMTRTGRRGRTD
jgi:hypothetical protein